MEVECSLFVEENGLPRGHISLFVGWMEGKSFWFWYNLCPLWAEKRRHVDSLEDLLLG